MTNIIKNTLIGLITIGGLLLVPHAKAFVITDNTSSTASIRDSSTSRSVFQSFKATFNGSSTVYYWGNYQISTPDMKVSISNAYDTLAEANASMGSNGESCDSFYPNDLLITSLTATKAQHSFELPIPLVLGKYYSLCFGDGGNGAGASVGTLYGNASDVYLFGQASSSEGQIEDFALEINPADASLSITYPEGNSTINDFSDWNLALNTSNNFCGTLVVKWGANSSTPAHTDSGGTLCRVGESIENTLYIKKGRHDITGVVYAQAILYSNTGAVIVQSDQITFDIVGGFILDTSEAPAQTLDDYLNSTSTNASSSIWAVFRVDCSAYDDNDAPFFSSSTVNGFMCEWKKSVMYILGGLFVPPDFIDNYMMSGIDRIKSVFPLNIVFDTVNTFKTIANSNENATGETLTVSIGGNTGINNVTFLNSTTLNDIVGSELKTEIYTISEYIIWSIMGVSLLAIIL